MPFGNQAYGGNPIYGLTPTTPPGLAGFPYMFNDIVAGFTGGHARPYVPVNMSTADAQIAKSINRPFYGMLASNMYGQYMSQLANTVAATPIVDALSGMTGYSQEQMRREISNGGRWLGAGPVGQFIAPMADALMEQSGLSGGSFIKSMEAINNGRLGLLSPVTYYDPLSTGQAHQAMSAASAMMTLTNGLMSRRDEKTGYLTVMANNAMTQGFDRQYISKLMMQAAGAGMFTSRASGGFGGNAERQSGGFLDQISKAANGYDISGLSFDDFLGEGPDKSVDDKTAGKLREVSRMVADRQKGIVEALGAMRDLTNEIDGLEEKLTSLTNGDWLRSRNGAYTARDATFKLKALSSMYNLDPNEAIGMLQSNKAVLQSAAGISPHMQAIGMHGGGMFGYSGQLAVFQDIQDKITASGARGDPVAEGRIMYQGVNSLARSMNTTAGRGAQLLAYARQVGIISDATAERYRMGLTSGDRGVMNDSLNRLLVTMFGSEETGRKMMNDSMYMQGMRMRMDDNAGAYANKIMVKGASAEMLSRELHTAADQRISYANAALKSAGMKTTQSAAGVDSIVKAVMADLSSVKDDKGKAFLAQYGTAFQEQVKTFQEKGMSAQAALNATISAFKKSPATANLASRIELAVKRQTAQNNEDLFLGEGAMEAAQANALTKDLVNNRLMDGKQASEIYKMLRDKKGKEALSVVDKVLGGLSSSQRDRFMGTREAAAKKYKASEDAIHDNRAAEDLLKHAQAGGWGSGAVSEAIRIANSAAVAYFRDMKDPAKASEAYEKFWSTFSKSRFGEIYGNDEEQGFLKAVEAGDLRYIRKMGRVSEKLGQMASSVLKSNGWDLTYSGFFNSGLYAGNSDAAAKRRDAIIGKMSRNLLDDSMMSSEDRDTMAQDIVGFLTGEKDWKGLLKIYDKEGKFKSNISKYIEANEGFISAQKDYSESRKGYQTAMRLLSKHGHGKLVEAISRRVGDGSKLTQSDISQIEESLEGLDYVLGDNGKNAITESLSKRLAMNKAQSSAERELENTGNNPELAKSWKEFSVRRRLGETRKERLMKKNAATFSYMDDLDLDEKSIRSASGKLKSAYDAMFKLVTDEEVAKKAGVSLSKDKDRSDYAQTAIEVLKEKALKGDDGALDVVKKFRASAADKASKITGKITIEHNGESSPAVIEASIGGNL